MIPTLLHALVLQDGAGEPPATQPEGGFSSFLFPMIAIFAIFYFVMIGPDRKQRKKRDLMLAELKKGDKVLTTSGMYGQVAAIQDDVVTLQVADGVRVRFSRAAIQSVIADEVPAEPKKD